MRAAGVPARIVTGYQGGEFNPLGGYLLVRQSDAHAWSEIWVAGRGWLRVDPTAAVAPDRIERGITAPFADAPALARIWEDSRLVSQAQLVWDYVNDFWNERVVRFDERLQFSLLQRLGVDAPDWRTLGLGLTAVSPRSSSVCRPGSPGPTARRSATGRSACTGRRLPGWRGAV